MPHVDDDGRALIELYRRLDQVLAAKDWTELGRVDLAIRAQLQQLNARDGLSADTQALSQRLQALHGKAYEACADESERLRRLLLSHLEYADGRMAYMQVDLMQGRS